MMQSASFLPIRRRNRSTLNPWARAGSVFNSIPRRSAAISAVCEARGSGLVKMASAENLRRCRNFATRFISLRPRSVSGRSSSGLFQFGQSASPWRRKQSFMMLEGKIVGQAFPPAISNQWRPGMAALQYCCSHSSSQNHPLWAARAGLILPDALAAEISVPIVTQLDAWWQLFEQLRVAATEHDVVDDKSALQLSKNALDIFFPDFPSNLFQACFADTIFNCALVEIRQLS